MDRDFGVVVVVSGIGRYLKRGEYDQNTLYTILKQLIEKNTCTEFKRTNKTMDLMTVLIKNADKCISLKFNIS